MPSRLFRSIPLPVLLAVAFLPTSCARNGCEAPRRAEGPDALRVLVRSEPIAFLPHNADPVELEREIAKGLARSMRRPLELILADDYASMISQLLAGEADVIAANLTATKARREQVDFSMPYLTVDELLVRRAEAPEVEEEADLLGVEIAVRESSSYAETLRALKERVPGVEIRWMPETDDAEDILDRLVDGEIEATLVDSNIWSAVAGHYVTLRAGPPLAEDRPIALAIRPGEGDLRRLVNEHLIARALTGPRPEAYVADLPELKRRGRLRMITRNGASTYFLHRGEQMGFEYDLMRRFADSQGLRLEIVIPPPGADLETWLEDGRGDVIAAAQPIPANPGRGTAFTRRVATVDRVLVVREDEAGGIGGPEDLVGRTVRVREGSAFEESARALLARSGSFRIAPAPENLETEDLLDLVESGVYDVTVCDSHQLAVARRAGAHLAAAFPIGETDLGWAVRGENEELRLALDRFLRREYRSLHYNLAWTRYFDDDGVAASPEEDAWRSDRTGRISPWDDFARRYAAAYDLDWRLLVAQMYQESRFDPNQVSLAGATGLMQIVPRTARELGVVDLRDPESSIEGGARYLRWLMDREDPKLPLATRIRFALASYNAGRSHVLDARRLAQRLGLDPDLWEGNVEQAILLLERREYFEKARFGYCRGSECVQYVREIDRRYRTWVEHVPTQEPAAGI